MRASATLDHNSAEKASGAWRERPELAKLKAQVTYGDVVVVTRLDRLARSTRDLLNLLAELTDRGVGLRSIKDAGATPRRPRGSLCCRYWPRSASSSES
jgi:DNA invertase Pin-like site-specific DNA recombinase